MAVVRAPVTNRRGFLRQSGVGLGALSLFACSSGDDDPAAAAQDDAASGAPGTSAEPTPAPSATSGTPAATATSAIPATSAATEPASAADDAVCLTRPVAMTGRPEAVRDIVPSDFLWTQARVLFVTTPIATVDDGHWLPPGLRLSDPPTATFFIAHYPLTQFRSVYNEAAVLLHVVDEKGPAWHCAWMVVDDDTALIYGRELLGFPKKLAEITLDETGDRVVGTVTRHGTEVMRLEADVGSFTDEMAKVWNAHRIVNVHGSIIGGMHLLDLAPLEEEVHDRSVGRASVALGSTDRDPLGELEPKSEGDAVWASMDFAKLQTPVSLAPEPLDGGWSFQMSIFSPRVQ